MAYRGNFARSHANPESDHPPRLNWGTGVDPRHADPMWGTDQGFPRLVSPPMPKVPTHVTDPYDPESSEAVYVADTVHEPKGHDATGLPPSNRGNLYDVIASNTARHQDDRGATLKDRENIVGRSYDQTFATPREQSLAPTSGDEDNPSSGQPLRALRGLNSLQVNNPGSAEVNYSGNYIRQGYEISRITNRRMPRRTLQHDRRPIHLNLAQTAAKTMGPQGENYSPYSSPFRSVGRYRVGAEWPMQRREPRPWDEDVITDGSESYHNDTSQYSSWGM